MICLQDLLNQRSHRDLELTARAHKLYFSRRIPKAEGLAQLSNALHSGRFQKAIKALTPNEIEALQALVAVGATMNLKDFCQHFGTIRRYRPWHSSFNQAENPRHPWRYPTSVAEKLFHLGMIHLNDYEQIELLQEVAEALPALPEQIFEPENDFHPDKEAHRDDLLHDLCAMLGILMKTQARPIYGRWLSLSVMREINQVLTIQDDLSECRSELQSGRIRWLHYLLQISGLIYQAEGSFIPSLLAWDWLEAPPQVKWDMLWHSVEHDLSKSKRLWDLFQFPELDHFSALVIRHLVEDCRIGKTYRIKDILSLASPYLLESDPYSLAIFMRDMLAWSGIVTYHYGRVKIQSRDFSEAQDSLLMPLSWLNRELPIKLAQHPHTRAYTRLLTFAEVRHNQAILHLSAVQSALKQAYDCATVIDILEKLTGKPLPEETIQQLEQWFNQAQNLRLESVIVLHSDDSEQIRSIHRDWRLRSCMKEKLSEHHIVIYADQSSKFLIALIQLLQQVSKQYPRCDTGITKIVKTCHKCKLFKFISHPKFCFSTA